MAEIDEELQENYHGLVRSTGEPYESIADRVEEHGSPELAAWLRRQAAGKGEVKREEAPKQRRGKGSVAAAEAADDKKE